MQERSVTCRKTCGRPFCGKYVEAGAFATEINFLAVRLYSWHTIRKCSVPWFLKQGGQIPGVHGWNMEE